MRASKSFLFGLVLLLRCLTASAQDDGGYTFTTLAGLAGGDNVDGIGTAARFRYPHAIASDVAGNLYVVDVGLHTLRKITPHGAVSTLAGRADYGGDADGHGSDARLSAPIAVSVAPDGTIYLIEAQRIRKVTPEGMVSAFAGQPHRNGSSDGAGAAATFSSPAALAVDVLGNVFVADTENDTIRKITPDGSVTTIAGRAGNRGFADGAVAQARFCMPRGIAVDRDGTIWVADTGNDVIRRIANGTVTTIAGVAGQTGYVDGPGASARFTRPAGLAFDVAGNLYVGDSYGQVLRKVSRTHLVSTLVGDTFPMSNGMAVDTAGSIYLPDSVRGCVIKISAEGARTVFAGNQTSVIYVDGAGSAARFRDPTAVAVAPDGTVYVADLNAFAVRKITTGGVVSTLMPRQEGSLQPFEGGWPSAVAVDAAGTLFVADVMSHIIYKVSPAGIASPVAGDRNVLGWNDGIGSNARFNRPVGIALDREGNLYVADGGNFTIRKITPNRVVTTLAGTAGKEGHVDGAGSAARFRSPWGITVGPSGNIFVSDTTNAVIRKITSQGVVTTYGPTLGLRVPKGIAVDPEENVFVVESGAHSIRKLSPEGTNSIVAGEPYFPGSDDGAGSFARFYNPSGIAFDRFGHLVVADTSNQTIRRGMVSGARAPTFVVQPTAGEVGEGREAVLAVEVAAVPTPILRWQRRATGSSTFVDLAESSSFRGVATATLQFTAGTGTATGDQFRCVVANGVGAEATSRITTLTVVGAPVFTSANTATFQAGLPGAFAVKATRATSYRLIAGALPAWAVLDPGTGVITGTPSDASGSPYRFTLEASNSAVVRSLQGFTLVVDPGPIFTVHPTGTSVVTRTLVRLAATAVGSPPLTYQWMKDGVALADGGTISGANSRTLTITKSQTSDAGIYRLAVTGRNGTVLSNLAPLSVLIPPTILTSPAGKIVAAGSGITFSVEATDAGPLTYQWLFNGQVLVGATGTTLTIPQATASRAGQYSVRVSNAVASFTTLPAVLALATTAKVDGHAAEHSADIEHPNGRIYDQVLLNGPFASLTADPHQVVRMSYMDLSGDIVQVEFAGAGTLSLRLDGRSGPILPNLYNQSVSYMKGHATIVVANADETSNIAIFSVGRLTALDQAIFKEGVEYDGVADIAALSVSSRNGKFGGVFTGNVGYSNTQGITGIYAPGVEFTGPVVVGNISAHADATPVFLLGSAAVAKVTGGELAQANERPVQVSGVTRLEFVAGMDAHGVTRPARQNEARLEANGIDVTYDLVVNPQP